MSNYTLTTIWKFPLGRHQMELELQVPTAFKPLYVGLDPQGQHCLWALVDPSKSTRALKVWIVGTGHTMPQGWTTYLGTILEGSFVWHVFI